MTVPEIAIIVSAITAFIVALIGQILTHYFSNQREIQKYTNEIYQQFLSMILVELLFYYDTRTAYSRGHDIIIEDETRNYINIMKNIEENKKYIGINTLFEFHQLKTTKQFDQSDFLTELQQLSLFRTLINDSYQVIKKFSKFDIRGGKKQFHILDKYLILYHIWIEYTDRSSNSIMGCILSSYNFYFDKSRLRNSFFCFLYYKLMKLVGHKNIMEKTE